LALVAACDAPLIQPQILRFLVSELGPKQAAIPIAGDRVHPLFAVYRTGIHRLLGQLIAEGALRAGDLAKKLDANLIPAESLRRLDPGLDCLKNINRPSDYFELLDSIGLDCEPDLKTQLSSYDRNSD
jgi:molybdopterin-guanine dinucleotide biosynthesis protein A